MIKLQREPAGPEVIRVPGGKPVAVLIAVVGLLDDDAHNPAVGDAASRMIPTSRWQF